MATVHFYTHETLEQMEPTGGLGQRFRRWLVRMVSPRFGHCALEHDGYFWHLDYQGYADGDACYLMSDQGEWECLCGGDAFADAGEIRDGELGATGRPPFLAWRMVLAFFWPRKFDNCASYVGRLIGCPDARTPDELHRLLTEHKRCEAQEAALSS